MLKPKELWQEHPNLKTVVSKHLLEELRDTFRTQIDVNQMDLLQLLQAGEER